MFQSTDPRAISMRKEMEDFLDKTMPSEWRNEERVKIWAYTTSPQKLNICEKLLFGPPVQMMCTPEGIETGAHTAMTTDVPTRTRLPIELTAYWAWEVLKVIRECYNRRAKKAHVEVERLMVIQAMQGLEVRQKRQASAKSFDSALHNINVKHGEGVALAERLYVQALQHADDMHAQALHHMDDMHAQAVQHTDDRHSQALHHKDDRHTEALQHTVDRDAEAVQYADDKHDQGRQYADQKHDEAIRHVDKSQKYVQDKLSAIEASGRSFTNNRFMACITYTQKACAELHLALLDLKDYADNEDIKSHILLDEKIAKVEQKLHKPSP
ncbi:hypothetical protein BGX38DRAFT_1261617 [Terfezia claveryi]|nr:hypothetical protein BGX38DRAFT_1261617 [Terfezia claveryi]